MARHPVSRLPVFCMGILGGLQAGRGLGSGLQNTALPCLHDIIPWGVVGGGDRLGLRQEQEQTR